MVAALKLNWQLFPRRTIVQTGFSLIKVEELTSLYITKSSV